MKLLLVLASYLAPIVHKPSLAVGVSQLLLLTVGPPLLGLGVVAARLLHAPTFSLLALGLTVGAFVGFGMGAQRFVTTHRAAILARSHLRTWPRLRAVGLLAGAYLLFVGLLMAA